MPPRRSESPEGVGDLLKQDSFGFEEEDVAMQEVQGSEVGNGAVEMQQDAGGAREGQSASKGQDFGKAIPTGGDSGKSGQASGQGAKSFSFRGRGPARYFIVKSNNHSNIDHSIKNGIWATQVCY